MLFGFRLLRVAMALAIFSCSSGCANLDDVAELSKVADNMRSSLPVVSEDIAATCERRGKLLAETPDEEKSPMDKPQDCAPFHLIADRVAADQKVLVAYLDALARLANNRPPAYRANIASNVTTLSGYSGVSPHVESASIAAQKILGSLADLATAGYRTKHLTKLLEMTDPAVQQLTTALKDIIANDYTILLANEQTSLATYYEAPMAAQKGERLALILVQRQYDADAASLANHLALARAYGQVMTSVAATHSTLTAKARSGASVKKLAEDLGPSLTNLEDAVAGLAATEKR